MYPFNTQYLILLFASIFATILPASNTQAALVDNACELTLGWHHWPPFQYLDDNNTPIGLQIDLSKKLAQEIGCKINLVRQDFEQNLSDIKNGNIDLTFDITITDERKKYGHFSIPYRKELLVLYVKPEFIQECKKQPLSNLIKSGFRLSLTKGVRYGSDVARIQKDPDLDKLIHYQGSNETELDLFINDKLDGILEDPAVIAYMKRKEPKLKNVESCQITLYSGLVSMMFSKKTVSTSLVNQFNAALKKIRRADEYRWLWGL